MATVGAVIGYVLTAYSVVSAVKALQDGNILGAVVAGFGAYMGISSIASASVNTASFGSEMALESSAATVADTGVASGVSGLETMGNAATTFASSAPNSAFSQMGAVGANALGASAGAADYLTNMGGTGVLESSPAAGFDTAATSIAPVSASSGASGMFDTAITSIKDAVGSVITQADGSLLDEAGNLFSGRTGEILQLAKAGLGYMQMGKAQDKQIKAARDAEERGNERSMAAEQRVLQEAGKTRARVGAAPSYVYDFKGRKGATA